MITTNNQDLRYNGENFIAVVEWDKSNGKYYCEFSHKSGIKMTYCWNEDFDYCKNHIVESAILFNEKFDFGVNLNW